MNCCVRAVEPERVAFALSIPSCTRRYLIPYETHQLATGIHAWRARRSSFGGIRHRTRGYSSAALAGLGLVLRAQARYQSHRFSFTRVHPARPSSPSRILPQRPAQLSTPAFDGAHALRTKSNELRTGGLAILRGSGFALAASEVALLREAVAERFQWLLSRAPREKLEFADCSTRSSFRWDITVPALWDSAFSFLHSGSTFHEVLRRSLRTPDFRLMHCGALLAWPQDTGVLQDESCPSDQLWHRDEAHEPDLSTHWNPYAVSVYVPLVDITDRNGTTEFLPGSQLDYLPNRQIQEVSGMMGLWPLRPAWSTEGLQAGDVVLFDVRLLHRGMLNVSAAACGVGPRGTRPVLQLTFGVHGWQSRARNWGQRLLADEPEPPLGGARRL